MSLFKEGKNAIEEVKDLKEDIKQYNFDGLKHDELATLNHYRYMMDNRHYYNIWIFVVTII